MGSQLVTTTKQRRKRFISSLVMAMFTALPIAASAGIIEDSHGNTGYTSAEECDQAVLDGTANFYKSFTFKPPLLRNDEVSYEVKRLGDVAGYELGACDRGIGRAFDRDGVSTALIGSYVPYSPDMKVNAYRNAEGDIVRLMMKQCDNNFSRPMPRPVQPAQPQTIAEAVSTEPARGSECYADILIPARFETRTEEVVKVPATKRYEAIPATYKTVTEEVLTQPEMVRQIPVPATYKTVTEEVIVKPATVRLEPVPPTFKTVEETILVKEESTQIKVIPATYKTETQRLVSKEASVRLIPYPATYKTVTETIQVSESYTEWKRGRAWIGQAIDVRPLKGFEVDGRGQVDGASVAEGWDDADNNNLEDDVMCLVEMPAKFQTITKRVVDKPAGVREEPVPEEYCNCKVTVVDQPARTETIKIPAEYRTVTRKVLETPGTTREIPVAAEYETVSRRIIDQPASFREEIIPAKYETLTRKVIDTPASTREIEVPAQYETLSYRVQVSEPSTERRAILCETNATPSKIKEIQRALREAGFDPGDIDGLIRSQTMRAVNAYQQANDLPVDGYLNIETVEALGVSPQ